MSSAVRTDAAILITDLVDSTRLVHTLGDAEMSTLLEAHDRQARDLMREWRGQEIDKSDGFLMLFDTVDDALGHARAYHRLLDELPIPLKARAGLHIGPVIRRRNADDDIARGAKAVEATGSAVPLAARVMSIALPGQTLLTHAAMLRLDASAAPCRSCGHWALKGVSEPVELFETGDDAVSPQIPVDTSKAYRVVLQGDLWLPIRSIRHTLPAERDRFVGRSDALRVLWECVEAGARCISVTAVGGAGKTRLAQRFGWSHLGDFEGGVWFCDLAQARTLDGIVHAVAQGLDLALGQADPVAQIGQALAGRDRCLVILDNFEQVTAYANASVGRWLDMAPEARLLVTSRHSLGIAGEQVFELEPLGHADGAALFRQRAQSASRHVQLTDEDKAAIDCLVGMLDGLPLAIELAAARIRVMTPKLLVERMSDRFALLAATGGRHPRQATLRATLDWSWDLLTAAEQSSLAQLSVFEGGFSALAAAQVVDLRAHEPAPSFVDVLQSLVEKSLARRTGRERFDLLTTVRDYASERLRTPGNFDDSGPAALAAARARHWRFFAALDEIGAVQHRCVELDNLVAACRRASASGDADAAVRTLIGAWACFKISGPLRSGLDLAQLVKASPSGLSERNLAAVRWVCGVALHLLGRAGEARTELEASLAASRASGDEAGEARALCWLSEQLAAAGDVAQARAYVEQALGLARSGGSAVEEWNALNRLGMLLEHGGQLVEARRSYETALGLAQRLGERRLEGGLLGNLGSLLRAAGDLEGACRHYEQSLALATDTGDRQWQGNARCNLGLLRHDLGMHDEAQEHFSAALFIAREMGHRRLESIVLCNLAITLEATGSRALAREHYDRAVALARQLGDRRSEGQFRGYLGLLYAHLGDLREARECLALGESMLTDVRDDLSLALLLCSSAQVEALADNPAAARKAAERARALAAAIGAGEDSELGKALAQLPRLEAP